MGCYILLRDTSESSLFVFMVFHQTNWAHVEEKPTATVQLSVLLHCCSNKALNFMAPFTWECLFFRSFLLKSLTRKLLNNAGHTQVYIFRKLTSSICILLSVNNWWNATQGLKTKRTRPKRAILAFALKMLNFLGHLHFLVNMNLTLYFLLCFSHLFIFSKAILQLMTPNPSVLR